MTREEKISVVRNLKNNAVRMGRFETALKFRNIERKTIGRSGWVDPEPGNAFDVKVTFDFSRMLDGMKKDLSSTLYLPIK